MKVDYDYIKSVLSVFVDSPHVVVEIREFENYESEEFIFHFGIIYDLGLVELTNPSGKFFEIDMTGNITIYSQVVRLTASGHQFYDALSTSKFWEKVKSEFYKYGVSTVIMLGQEYLKSLLIPKQ